MLNRFCFGTFLAAICALPFTGCSNTQVGSIQISPSAQSLVVSQTVQFAATGIIGHGAHPTSSQDVTSLVSWTSSTPSVATVNANGLATAVSAGNTTIMASMSGSTSATAVITVTGGSGGSGGSLTSLAIIPGSQSVASPSQTTQFIAIGTTSLGATINLTSQVAWSSSSVQIATISPATGLATAVGKGTTTITAIYSNPSDGTSVTGTATFTVTGGTTEQYTAVSITPNAQSLSASGQTGQFIALATSGSTGLLEDVTNSAQIQWISSAPSVVSVGASGLATGLSQGTSTVTAKLTNPDNSVVSSTAAVTVSLTSAPEPLLSLAIVPGDVTVGNLQATAQFLAIGTFSTVPYVRDLTNSVTWISSQPDYFPVNNSTGTNTGTSGGIVTAYSAGSAVIIAEATSTDGTIQTATATFNCPLVLPNPPVTAGSCYPGSQTSALKSTLTVFNEGLDSTHWQVTAPSATGTPDVIHCGPGWTLNGGTGGSVCSAPYPIGVKVVVTAPAGAGAFGGWSSNCTPSDVNGNPLPGPIFWTAAGPNYCTVTLTTNETVGAIFN